MTSLPNRLMALLPPTERRRLRALCEPVTLAFGEELQSAGSDTRHVYFPTSAFISLIAVSDGKPVVEVGLVGAEGMLGVQLALGMAPAPLLALVQGPGVALRADAAAFRAELAASAPLRTLMQRYIYVLMGQMATSAACLHSHRIGPRLARWLLMTQDRAHSPHFVTTQEFLAYMLGVRRVGITAAAGGLQRSGLIEYARGHVSIIDRKGLQAAACGCYASDRKLYAAALRAMPR